jgi:hypothetical protein
MMKTNTTNRTRIVSSSLCQQPRQHRNFLFLLLVIVFIVFTSIQNVYAQDYEVDTTGVNDNEIVAEVVHEPVPEPEEESTPEVVEEVVEEVIENVIEEVVEVEASPIVEEVVEPVMSDPVVAEDVDKEMKTIQHRTNEIMDTMKTKSKMILNRIKSMDQKDLKKVAGAALGVWGVSLAVGWLVAK